MGDCLLCTPNYVKTTFFPVRIGGGSFSSQGPLTNLMNKFFINKAISNDTLTTSTRFHVDLGAERDIKFFGIPNSNISKLGQVRVRASNTVKWSGITVTGINSGTSINVSDSSLIDEGDVITIAGDTTTYTVTAITSPTSIMVNYSLTVATVGSELITCHCGDYTTGTIYDSGEFDYFGEVYAPGVLLWGRPGVWDGKETDENLATLNLPKPTWLIFPNFVVAQYWFIEVSDTSNINGYISLDDLFLASGFTPLYNMSYGAVMGLRSNTTSESSKGGVEIFDEQKSGRYVVFTLESISVDDAFVNLFDMQRQLDISQDLYFIFDQDDTDLMTRRSFVARFETLSELNFATFGLIDINSIKLKEKLA